MARRRRRNTLAQRGFWLLVSNFLMNFVIAVVWLGRWTIKLVLRLWKRWGR